MNKSSVNQPLRELLFTPRARRRADRQAPTKVKAAFEAVREGDAEKLSRLVRMPKQANWRLPERAWCLLDEAVKSGSLAMVEWLVNHGANANTIVVDDRLFSAGDLCAPVLYFSPLATAIHDGKMEIAEFLLRNGAALDAPCWSFADGARQTCFDMAVALGLWPQLEATLIASGALQAAAIQRPKRL